MSSSPAMNPSIDLSRAFGRTPPRIAARVEGGYVLVVSVLILLIIMLTSAAMSRSFFVEEGMAGNIREKQRANIAAQTVLAYAEYWLTQPGNATTGVTCANQEYMAPIICNASLSSSVTGGTAADLPWNAYIDYTSSQMTVNASGGSGTYAADPGYYIEYVKTSADGLTNYYRITAFGYGGNADAVAVVQSTYQVTVGTGGSGGGSGGGGSLE